MKHKVAVIGSGYFGQRHIKILSQMEDVEIVGIVDKDIARAKCIASECGINCTENFRELLDDASIFFIVTPTNTHFEIAMELIERDKHLFIEKPLTENLEQAKLLLDKALKKNIIFQVGMIERYNPVVRTLVEHLEKPLFINMQRVSPFLGRATDTHVTFDLMIHDLDLLLMFMKSEQMPQILDFTTFKQSLVTEKIDFASSRLKFRFDINILDVQITASRISNCFQRSINIFQKNSAIYADLIERKITKIDKSGKASEVSIKNKDSQPLYEEIRDFLCCVKEKRLSKIAPSPEQIIEGIKIITLINGGTKE